MCPREDETTRRCDRQLRSARLVDALIYKGTSYAALARHGDALTAYDAALQAGSDLPDAWLGRGSALADLRRYEEAAAAFEKLLALRPERADAWLGYGNVLSKLQRHEHALRAFDSALAREPHLAEAYIGGGNACWFLCRYDDALAAFDRVRAMRPDLPEAWVGYGNCLFAFKKYVEAHAALRKALLLNPEMEELEGDCLRLKRHVCDWTDYDAECERVMASVRNGKLVLPFLLLCIPSSPEQQFDTRRWIAQHIHVPSAPMSRAERCDAGRIHVAYLSSDFSPTCHVLLDGRGLRAS